MEKENSSSDESVGLIVGVTGMKSRDSSLVANGNNQVEAEWIEQDEPGVYITLVALPDGTRDLKRVRFRYFFISFNFRY